jgi:ferredoxin
VPLRLGRLGRDLLTARPVVDTARCTGCGACRVSCPAGAISIETRLAHINNRACIRCYCCQEMCPEGAMQLRPTPLARLLHW